MPNHNSKVDFFFLNAKKWKEELNQLRSIVLDCGLNEELKWGVPCYTLNNGNVLIIHGFKDYCAFNFFKGSLLNDFHGILIQQTENSQSARQIRFTQLNEIIQQEATLKAYIFEAIELEKAGIKVVMKKTEEFKIPEELTHKFSEFPTLKNAFYALTPGRQRAYLLFFSAPLQSATREARIEKNMQRIFNGKGLNDCICGLSKKMPACDGSHKNIQ